MSWSRPNAMRGAPTDGSGNWHGYRVPFLYSTNGEVIHFVDVRSEKTFPAGSVSFTRRDALDEMFGRESGFEWFRQHPVQIERLRPYQKQAIEAVETAICQGQARHAGGHGHGHRARPS